MNRLVVLDTNIIVSAGIKSGPAARIVEAALSGNIIVATCPLIVVEYWAVLQRPRFTKFDFPPLWLETLLHLAHHLTFDPPDWPYKGPDPDDLIFLALAKYMGAVLVTGNEKDFPTRIRDGVVVTSPAAY